MKQVTVKGSDMEVDAAAEMVLREVAARDHGQFRLETLAGVLREWVNAESRFSVHDAIYQKTEGTRLN
jgi:hypothetical protein